MLRDGNSVGILVSPEHGTIHVPTGQTRVKISTEQLFVSRESNFYSGYLCLRGEKLCLRGRCPGINNSFFSFLFRSRTQLRALVHVQHCFFDGEGRKDRS